MLKFGIICFTFICAVASERRRCPLRESYYECTPDRKNTCEYFGNPAAKFACGPPGCFCREGLVKRKDGACIKYENCNKTCSKDEVIVGCAKPKWCNTCGIRGNCKLTSCDEGCDCKENYFRDENEICVPASQCPSGSYE